MAKMHKASEVLAVSIDGAAEYEPLPVNPVVRTRTVETRVTLVLSTFREADQIAAMIEAGAAFHSDLQYDSKVERATITETRRITLNRSRGRR